jgi:hypothetical protein
MNEIEALEQSIAARVAELRAQPEDIREQITPLDKLMVEDAQYGALKNHNVATKLLDELETRV